MMKFNWMNNLLTALAEGDAAVQGTTAAGAGGILEMIIMVVIFGAIFYFMLIRPQRKKDKAVKNMLDALKAGDRICTIGGIYGTISEIKNDTIVLKVGGQQTPMVIARWAVRSVEDAPLENDAEPTA